MRRPLEDFEFLRHYIESLSYSKKDSDYKYFPNSGKSEKQITYFAVQAGLRRLPSELNEFYKFSYGAHLGQYKILTISEITDALYELSKVPKELQRRFIFPFAQVTDAGDLIAFDLRKSNSRGFLILDGFHEYPPVKWKSICFGLRVWLQKIASNSFEPFWLTNK